MGKTKKQNQTSWLLVALLGTLLAAPNPTFVKLAGDINPFLFNAIRFSAVAVCSLPFLLRRVSRIRYKNMKYATTAGICMVVAALSFVMAVQTSQASYVPIITLITPIVFVVLSARLTGERISHRAVAGIALAALGAFTVLALPLLMHNSDKVIFYPVGTAFALLNSFSFVLAIIFYRKANDAGLPMPAVMNVSAWIVATVNAGIYLLSTSQPSIQLDRSAWIAVLYSGLVVILLARTINVISYEHLGSALTGMLVYLENILAVAIPILLLGEKISIEMAVGGALILAGVYVVEHHKSQYHRHHSTLRDS